MNVIKALSVSMVTRYLLYVLIFFQPFNHFNSFREISYYALIILFLINLYKGGIRKIELKDITIIAILLILAWSVMVSLSGPYPAESLNAVRKNLLKHVVIFFVIITEFKSFRDLKPLLWVVVLSFAAVSLASIVENTVNDWHTFISLTPTTVWRSSSTYFFANYPDNATFYLPFIAGWLFAIKESSSKKWIGVITLMTGFVLVYIYNARTHMVAVLFAFLVIIFLARRYKLIAVFALAMVLSVSIIATSKYDGLSRYKTLLNLETYTSDAGLTNRLGLWQVVMEIIKERPLNGYGYGWKKIAWIMQEKNTDEFWENHLPSARSYYVDDAGLMYGRVNPHNLPLQIAFEIGIAGLAIYIWLWCTVLWKIFRVMKTDRDAQGRNFVAYSAGVIISFVIVNITNSLWQENYGMMIFLFMALIYIVHREHTARAS